MLGQILHQIEKKRKKWKYLLPILQEKIYWRNGSFAIGRCFLAPILTFVYKTPTSLSGVFIVKTPFLT